MKYGALTISGIIMLTVGLPIIRAEEGFGVCCRQDGSCLVTSSVGCAIENGSFDNTIFLCSEAACDGACCLVEGTCSQSGFGNCPGTFQGLGTVCATAVCGGACCEIDGTCTTTGPTSCNGTFEGLGSDCIVAECTGACCPSTGGCEATGTGTCAGEFHGLGSDCASTSCPFGACCLPEKLCIEVAEFECASIGGAFQGDGTLCAIDCPQPMSTAFTYQGQMAHLGKPVNDLVDFRFSLWINAEGDQQVGSTTDIKAVQVKKGLFNVELDFGIDPFNGNARWLEVAVCRNCNGVGPFTVLSPRQPITPTPYALQTRGIVVDESANVGIGTKTPLAPLHVVGPPTDSSVILPDATISAAEVRDEPGVSRTARLSLLNSLPIETSATVILQRDIVAPADGFIVALATIEVRLSHTNGVTDAISLWVSEDPTGANPFEIKFLDRTPAALPTSSEYGFLASVHASFDVTAGVNTLYTLGQKSDEASDYRVADARLTLMYFPTSYAPTTSPSNAHSGN